MSFDQATATTGVTTVPDVGDARACIADNGAMTLDRLAADVCAEVVEVVAGHAHAEWARWLAEIGFIAGERVTLLSRGPFGGDPLAVRIGASTFALRRAEAACVRVRIAR